MCDAFLRLSALLLLVALHQCNAGCYTDNLCCEARQTACYADKTELPRPMHVVREFAETRVRESHIVVEELVGPDGQLVLRRTISRLYAPVLEPIVEVEGSGHIDHQPPNDTFPFDESGSDAYQLVRLPVTRMEQAPRLEGHSVDVQRPAGSQDDNSTDEVHSLLTAAMDVPVKYSARKLQTQDFVNRFVVVNQRELAARFRGSKRGRRVVRNVIFRTIPADTLLQVEHIPPIPLDNRCFCDGACSTLGDCCPDFRDTCKPVDCVQSEWSDWGGCRAAALEEEADQVEGSGQDTQEHCGMGVQQRERSQLQPAHMGGRACGHSRETRVCYNYCHDHVLREVALLLPHQYNKARVDTDYPQMYSQLRHTLPALTANETSYCLSFTPVWTSRHCGAATVKQTIFAGAQNLTIMCHPLAMNEVTDRCTGEGVLNKRSFWKLARNGDKHKYCFGSWQRSEEEPSDCSDNPPSYIFV